MDKLKPALVPEFNTIMWLSLRDYGHEWRMSACFILALAAVLAPMMVLFGLKFGIVGSMAERLIQDPRNREIWPVGSGRFDLHWFETLRARQDVAFVIPRTRQIAATISLQNTNVQPSQIVDVELIPTGEGDPLLIGQPHIPQGLGDAILSDSAARKLKVVSGDVVDGSLARVFRGTRERVHLPLTVLAVAQPGAFAREGAFISLDLLVAAEDYRDGRTVPALGWTGDEARRRNRTYAGFRLYAQSVYDVLKLRAELEAQGIEVRTRSADIEIVQSLDRNLSLIFWIIALVALLGFSLSLGASLWANVDRKRRELSVLRLVGFHTKSVIWFPVLQASFTGLFGWVLASLIYLGVEHGLNQLFRSSLNFNDAICHLLPEHFYGAMGFTLFACIAASALGGWKVSRIEPSEGIREI
jgi:putative ABC transport system permease protein